LDSKGLAEVGLGKIDQAVQDLHEAITKNPNDILALLYLKIAASHATQNNNGGNITAPGKTQPITPRDHCGSIDCVWF